MILAEDLKWLIGRRHSLVNEIVNTLLAGYQFCHPQKNSDNSPKGYTGEKHTYLLTLNQSMVPRCA